MSHHYRHVQAYKQAAHTVSKTRQIVMLYDGMIRFIQQARQAMLEKRIEDRYQLLVKASTIISGLQGCLDFEQGQDVSTTLYDYYAVKEAEIFTLHRVYTTEQYDKLIIDLKHMREAWNAIDASPSPADAHSPEETCEIAERTATSLTQGSTACYGSAGFMPRVVSALMVSA
jgi:flagellar secretion chaperone FliS